jgi:UrcA family protein
MFFSGLLRAAVLRFTMSHYSRQLFLKGEPMKKQILFLGAIFLLAGMSSITVAQSTEPTEEVTVFAPYVVTKTVSKKPKSIPVTTINMSRGISYHGLDLTSDADVATLESRVKQAADDICNELDKRYSRGNFARVDQDKDCAKNAADSALTEIRLVVAAARGQ